jgi:hypothetical protein
MGVLFILGGLKDHVTFLEFLLAHLNFFHTHLSCSTQALQAGMEELSLQL